MKIDELYVNVEIHNKEQECESYTITKNGEKQIICQFLGGEYENMEYVIYGTSVCHYCPKDNLDFITQNEVAENKVKTICLNLKPIAYEGKIIGNAAKCDKCETIFYNLCMYK